MAKGDTFFLRTKLTSSGTDYVSDNIDISAYTDPARGRVLVVDRAFISFGTDGNGPIAQTDIGSGAASKAIGAQACSEKQTGLVEMTDNSLFMKVNMYAATVTGPHFSMINETSALNPAEYSAVSIPQCIASVGIIKPPEYSAGLRALVSLIIEKCGPVTVAAYILTFMNRELSVISTNRYVCFSV